MVKIELDIEDEALAKVVLRQLPSSSNFAVRLTWKSRYSAQ